MPFGLMVAIVATFPVSGAQPVHTEAGCDDLIGHWEYVSPPSPLPGVVEIRRRPDGDYLGQWRRVPTRVDDVNTSTWRGACRDPLSRWWVLFGTRPAPSCKGELREHATEWTIEWFCYTPGGARDLAGAARRTRPKPPPRPTPPMTI